MSKNYCKITSENMEHIKTLIKWLFEEVQTAGGDGDGIWHSNYYKVSDIKDLIDSESLYPPYWYISETNDDRISYNLDQECLVITNNEDDFTNRPSWQQVAIQY
jgi:hypothetical protein